MGVSDNLLIRQPKFLPNRLVTGQPKTVASLRGLGKNGPGKNGPGKNGPGNYWISSRIGNKSSASAEVADQTLFTSALRRIFSNR